MNYDCVICGKPCDVNRDQRVMVYLHSDVRTRGFGLCGLAHISYHTACELARQERARQLQLRRAARKALRWRRRLRWVQLLLGIRAGRGRKPAVAWTAEL